MSSLQTLRQRMQRERRDGLHSGPSYRDIPTTAPGTTSPMGKLRKDMRLQNQRNQVKLAAKSLHASPQTGVAIYDLRDKAIVQQELDTVTSELNALEKEYPSKVYTALSQKADLDVAVPMLGPVENDATLQKEVADYSARKIPLEKEKKTLEETLGKIDEWLQYYEKWGYIADESWFDEAAATRDYVNPTDEDLEIYDVMMDNKRWEVMPDGSMQDALGNLIPYESVDENHTLIHPLRDDPRYAIQDPLGLYLSTNEERRFQAYENQTDSNGLKGSKDRILIKGWENHWEQLSEEEMNMYYALLKEKGVDTALEYLDETAELRNSRWGKQEVERINHIANDFRRLTETARLGINSGIDQWGSGIAQAVTGEIRPVSGLQYANAEMNESLEGLYGYMYQGTNVVGNMLPSIVASKLLGLGGAGKVLAGTAGSVVVGVSSGGNAFGQALREGYSKEQAQSYGLMVGAAEFVLQDLIGGISDLGGIGTEKLITKLELIDNSLLRIAGKMGTKIGSQISEEELQLLLEPVFRMIIFGEAYDAPTVEEMMETAIVTALSTGAMEGPSTIANDVITHHTSTEATYEGSISGMTHAAGHTTAVDTGFRKYYDSIIQMEGDLYGAEKANDVGRTEADTDANKRNTRTADAKRPGIQEAVGETGAGSAEVHLSGGLRRGLTASGEDFDAHDYVVVDENTELGHIRQELEHNGIECRVVRGDSWKRAAPAYAHNGRVYISQDIDQETLPTVIPHETTHVMKQRGFQQYLKYVEDIPDMLLMRKEEAWKLLDMAAKHRGVDMFEMGDTDFINLYDEMNAIVYGMYRGGILDDPRYDYGQWIPGAFKDFDGYIRQMDAIHDAFRQRNGAARTDPSGGDLSEVWSPGSQATSREALAWVLENKELREIEPRTRGVLREYGRHLQQLRTVESMQQTQWEKIESLQSAGTDASTLQTARRDLIKLQQLQQRQLQRLDKLEQKSQLQQLAQQTPSQASLNGTTEAEYIGRSVGAKSKNYKAYNPITGERMPLTEGTHITQPKDHIIAGKGRQRQIDQLDFLLDTYGGTALEWTKEKGFGYVDDEYGESHYVELHWCQEPTVGKVRMKIKVQSDGRIYLEED